MNRRLRIFFRSPGKLVLAVDLWLLAALPVLAQPTNAPAVSLEDVSRAMAKARTVFTRFVQERHLSLFNEPLRSEGCLCFERPGRVRWEITSPYQVHFGFRRFGCWRSLSGWMKSGRKLDAGLAARCKLCRANCRRDGGPLRERQPDYTVTLAASPEGPVITLVRATRRWRKMMQAIEVHLAADLNGTRRIVLRETGRGLHGHPLQRTGRWP